MNEQRFTETAAAWISRTRKGLRLTQMRVAVELGVKRSTFCAWERGTRTMSAFHYLQLKKCFELHETRQATAPERTARP